MGDDHPEVARVSQRLALIYAKSARYAEAFTAVRRALAIREARLGATHVDVAESLFLLGTLLEGAGDKKNAMKTLMRAAQIALATLGEGHPLTERYVRRAARLAPTKQP